MMARQAALEKMGMPVEQQEFGFEDTKPFTTKPIDVIDVSVAQDA